MKVINVSMQGSLTLDDDTEIFSSIECDVIVPAGFRLDVHGIVTGTLTIEAGGSARIMGTMNGHIVNKGKLEVFGISKGGIETIGGETIEGETAFILG